jgi:hypothetical protein
MTTRSRRRLRLTQAWIVGVVACAVLVGAGLLVAVRVLEATVALTPRSAVRQYFTALAERDVDRILELESDLDRRSYAIRVLQSPDYQPPSAVRIGEVIPAGTGRVWVETSYLINDQPYSSTITVLRKQKPSIVGRRTWHTTQTLSGLQLDSPVFATPSINGRLIPQNSDVVPPLLPGSYRLVNSPNPLADIPPTRVAVPVGATGSADLAPHLKPGATRTITPLITDYVQQCVTEAARRTLNQDCKFLTRLGLRGGEDITLYRYPRIRLSLSGNGIAVTTVRPGRLAVSSSTSEDRRVDFTVSGFVYLDANNEPFFSPRI